MEVGLFVSLMKHLDAMYLAPLMLGIFKQVGVSVFYTCFMLYENFSEI
jgi:hypothetical protein